MKTSIYGVYGALVGVFLATGAMAGPITFDFTTGSGLQYGSSLSFEQDGLELTVSATNNRDGSAGAGSDLGTNPATIAAAQNYGLFVRSYRYDDHRIDGRSDEVVKFNFGDKEVSITSVTFSYFGAGDQFDFYMGDAGNLAFDQSGTVAKSVDLNATASTFAIGASQDQLVTKCFNYFLWGQIRKSCKSHYDYSAFKITSLTVEELAPVPLPAAGWMLIAGLAGLFGMRRRAA